MKTVFLWAGDGDALHSAKTAHFGLCGPVSNRPSAGTICGLGVGDPWSVKDKEKKEMLPNTSPHA